jgi:hypothetical protein
MTMNVGRQGRGTGSGDSILIKECGHCRKAAASPPRGWGFRRPLRRLGGDLCGPADSRQ